ncbi:hypothetical protein F2P81_020468 [Scophthalmus maximus]|uniref:Uncharacterized protein n=1 Tax=Scophthalmus maximus TaxID=52904 RepID=A0A6A4S3X4_SCOMX|nr:hypothetical protein F2P81_020468 [Scophthalmus maximus]
MAYCCGRTLNKTRVKIRGQPWALASAHHSSTSGKICPDNSTTKTRFLLPEKGGKEAGEISNQPPTNFNSDEDFADNLRHKFSLLAPVLQQCEE